MYTNVQEYTSALNNFVLYLRESAIVQHIICPTSQSHNSQSGNRQYSDSIKICNVVAIIKHKCKHFAEFKQISDCYWYRFSKKFIKSSNFSGMTGISETSWIAYITMSFNNVQYKLSSVFMRDFERFKSHKFNQHVSSKAL